MALMSWGVLAYIELNIKPLTLKLKPYKPEPCRVAPGHVQELSLLRYADFICLVLVACLVGS